jgi:hypothetical protein
MRPLFPFPAFWKRLSVVGAPPASSTTSRATSTSLRRATSMRADGAGPARPAGTEVSRDQRDAAREGRPRRVQSQGSQDHRRRLHVLRRRDGGRRLGMGITGKGETSTDIVDLSRTRSRTPPRKCLRSTRLHWAVSSWSTSPSRITMSSFFTDDGRVFACGNQLYSRIRLASGWPKPRNGVS